MSSNRQSTSVYHLTSLHRRENGSDTPKSKSTRKASRKVGTSWLAADDISAAWNVTKRRSKRTKQTNINDNHEVFDLIADGGNNDTEGDIATRQENERAGILSMGDGEVDGQASERPARTRRRRKRRKIDHNLSFLDNQPTNSHDGTLGGALRTRSVIQTPSSDLLKCIHQIASRYYAQRGQLLYAYKEHLRERQQRRRQKMKIITCTDSDPPSQGEISLGRDDASEESSTQTASEDESKEQSESPLQRDMYMTLDGTALVAIGMLLQEYVVRLLSPTASDHDTEVSLQRDSLLSGPSSPGLSV